MEDTLKAFAVQFPAAAAALAILWFYAKQMKEMRISDANRCDATIADLSKRLREVENGRIADAKAALENISSKMDNLISTIKEAGSGTYRVKP